MLSPGPKESAGIQKGGGTQQHSGCPGIVGSAGELHTTALSTTDLPRAETPRDLCYLCFPRGFCMQKQPSNLIFKSIARLERNRGEALLGVTPSLRLVLSNPRGQKPGKGEREVGGDLRFQELLAAHTGKIILPSLSH